MVQAGHCGRFQYLTVVVKVLRRQTYQKVARVIAKQAEQSATCIKKAGGTADLLGRDPDMPPNSASIPLRQSPLPIVGNCTSVVFEIKLVVDALRFKQSFAMVIDHG